MSEEEIKSTMLKPLNRIYPSFSTDQIKNIYVFKTNTAATVCDLNFSSKVPEARTAIQHLFIASMPHIYPDERSTNNSIRVAAQVCKQLGIESDFVPYGSSLSGQIGFLNNLL
jgi:hypothetical protein